MTGTLYIPKAQESLYRDARECARRSGTTIGPLMLTALKAHLAQLTRCECGRVPNRDAKYCSHCGKTAKGLS